MKRLIFATHNTGKVKEMRSILSGLGVEVLSAEEAGIFEDVIEDGKTFEENALKKAKFIADKTGEWAVADDSGLCIEALDGAPGIHSARWAGGFDLVEYTLAKMKDILDIKRSAYFKSVAALYASDGRHWFFRGVIRGRISLEASGVNRPKLPYDLIFIPDGYDRTFAGMSDIEKNSLSHRGLAFSQLKNFIADMIKNEF
ncbi:MAG: Non-canonical purine NTP pyrophosphatase [Parcubacteria group bacterium GW2011_GWA2_43_9b]|nr:MAG: Non-canonical purine NTP pyrophosphatase [Parcubacteria group bacterium GW2011_GWA2_43_9b]